MCESGVVIIIIDIVGKIRAQIIWRRSQLFFNVRFIVRAICAHTWCVVKWFICMCGEQFSMPTGANKSTNMFYLTFLLMQVSCLELASSILCYMHIFIIASISEFWIHLQLIVSLLWTFQGYRVMRTSRVGHCSTYRRTYIRCVSALAFDTVRKQCEQITMKNQ